MKLDNYICYTKDGKISSLGMEIKSDTMREKFIGGGLPKSFLRKNLGIPLSLFLINKKKNIIDDFINNTEKKEKKGKKEKKEKKEKKGKKKKKKSKCITDELFNKLVDLRANPLIRKKKTKKNAKKNAKKKTKKSLFSF